MSHRRSGRVTASRAALSLLEVVVSLAILAVIALAVMSSTMPLTDAGRDQAIGLDMDRSASRFLSQLRREVRQSGRAADGTDHVTSPPPDGSWGGTLTFDMRTGPEQTDWAPSITYTTSPSSPPSFSGVPGVIPRFRLRRTAGGLDVDQLDDVRQLRFRRPAPDTLMVELTLLRPAPRWTSSTAPAPIERVYRDTIQVMNRPD